MDKIGDKMSKSKTTNERTKTRTTFCVFCGRKIKYPVVIRYSKQGKELHYCSMRCCIGYDADPTARITRPKPGTVIRTDKYGIPITEGIKREYITLSNSGDSYTTSTYAPDFFYKVRVCCSNCMYGVGRPFFPRPGFGIRIKQGDPVSSQACPFCGCKTLYPVKPS